MLSVAAEWLVQAAMFLSGAALAPIGSLYGRCGGSILVRERSSKGLEEQFRKFRLKELGSAGVAKK